MAIIKVANRAIDLDAAEIPNLDASKITTGNFDASRIGSGTFADARISQSSVVAHSPQTDLQPVKSDISALALREATNESSAAFNLPNQHIDTFATDTLGTKTDVTLTDGYVASVTTVTSTSNAGGSDTNFGDGNTRWSSSNTSDQYGTGNDIGYNGSSYNYTFLSSSDGSDASHTPDSADALIVGNGKIWFDGVSHNTANSATGTSTDYYEWGLLTNYTGIENTAPTVHSSGSNIAGIICATGGQQKDIRVLKVTGGNTVTLLGTIASSEIPSSSSVITMARKDGRIYVLVADVLKFTVSASDFNDSSTNLAAVWAFGRGGSSARAYMNAGYRANMTSIKGLSTTQTSATGTAIQNTNTVGSAKGKVGGTMLYKDNAGTNTLGTDLKIYFTCNGGTNWTEASSYTAITPVYSTGIKQVRLGETTCTSGTDIRYKAVWANQASGSKELQLHGIGINY